MKITDWNISYIGNNNKKIEYLKKIVRNESAIIILQEVKPSAFELLKKEFNEYNLRYSLDYRRSSKYDTKARELGIVIITSSDLKIINSNVMDRCILPERTLFVEVEYNNVTIKILGLHSITGCDYKKAKSIQFHSFAEIIDEYKPDIVGIDANEPKIDNYDIEKMDFFDNKDKGEGARLFVKTLVENNLVDSFGIKYDIKKYKNGEPLITSYIINNKINRRYDFIFLNKDKFKSYNVKYNFKDSIEAGSDHSLIEITI